MNVRDNGVIDGAAVREEAVRHGDALRARAVAHAAAVMARANGTAAGAAANAPETQVAELVQTVGGASGQGATVAEPAPVQTETASV